MKTHAGDIHLELSGQWDDESSYVYRLRNSEVEVRVEHSPVGAEATPQSLMDINEQRLKAAVPMQQSKRGDAKIDGQPAQTLSARGRGKGDKDDSLVEAVVFKVGENQAVTITATAPGKKQAALATAWREILTKTKVVQL